jgi:hypothetical protein
MSYLVNKDLIMKRTIPLFLLLTMLILSACQNQNAGLTERATQGEVVAVPTTGMAPAEQEAKPTATAAAPLAKPTAEPVDEPATEVPATATVGESTLSGELTAQLDAFLQSQVYREGGDPRV